MEWFLIPFVAAAASLLTLFSGFGLGTLLMPVVALFFPLPIAIAITAVVHLANNLFKLVLIGRYANRSLVLAFGLPALLAAGAGAYLLASLSQQAPLLTYQLDLNLGPWAVDKGVDVQAVSFAIGWVILLILVLENARWFQQLSMPIKYAPFGGLLSGFFGGLSGHQGAFRSAFLLKAGLDKRAFVATGVVIACLVDLARLALYSSALGASWQPADPGLIALATLAAFAGAYWGSRLLDKITMTAIRRLVNVMLTVIALGLIAGLI